MSWQVSVKLVCTWGQIIVLNQTIPAEVDTKYRKFVPLSEMMSIPAVSFKRELLSTPNTMSGVMSCNRQLKIHISDVLKSSVT